MHARTASIIVKGVLKPAVDVVNIQVRGMLSLSNWLNQASCEFVERTLSNCWLSYLSMDSCAWQIQVMVFDESFGCCRL